MPVVQQVLDEECGSVKINMFKVGIKHSTMYIALFFYPMLERQKVLPPFYHRYGPQLRRK